MKFLEIPEVFFNSKTNSPLENCLICNKNLLSSGIYYYALKAYRYYQEYDKKDVTYEMALCFKCEEMLDESYSDESKKRVDKYFNDNMEKKRMLKLLSSENYNINDYISHCACKGKHWKETNSFYIYGLFQSSMMLYDSGCPYMLSDEAMEDIVKLLSNQTIDSLIKLFDIYVDFPPEFKSIFTKGLIKK